MKLVAETVVDDWEDLGVGRVQQEKNEVSSVSSLFLWSTEQQ